MSDSGFEIPITTALELPGTVVKENLGIAGRFDADELSRRLDVAYAGEDPEQTLQGLPPLAAPAARRRRWGRRHGDSGTADPSWAATNERFVDPTTQRVMRVWVDPADRSRHYVAEPPASGG